MSCQVYDIRCVMSLCVMSGVSRHCVSCRCHRVLQRPGRASHRQVLPVLLSAAPSVASHRRTTDTTQVCHCHLQSVGYKHFQSPSPFALLGNKAKIYTAQLSKTRAITSRLLVLVFTSVFYVTHPVQTAQIGSIKINKICFSVL